MNIIGEGVPNFVANQILVRQKVYGSGYLKSRTPSELVYLNANTSWCKLISGTNVNNSNELAKNYILFNGTTPNGIGINTINGAYTVAQDEFGFRPMPGIISANINHENKGSLKRAEVKIKAYNIEQFRILDLLYLRLGYNILLEWGHSMYYIEDLNKDKKLVKSLNGAGVSLSEDFLKGGIDYDEFLFKILTQRRVTHGNYDALFARVENFSWTFNKDGSYDITLKLISIGDVIESLKVNVSLPTSILAPSGSSDFQTSADVIRNYSSINSIGAWLQLGVPSIDLETLTEEAKKIQDPTYSRTVLPPATTQGITFLPPTTISNTPQSLDNSTGTGFKLPFDLIDPVTKTPINPNTNKPYANPLQSSNLLFNNPTFVQISFTSDLGIQYYVKLGDFLSFLQNGDSNQSSIIPKIFVEGKSKGVPQLKFNLIENQNLIYVDPAQISIDPTICFVKRNITVNNNTYSYSDDHNNMVDFTIDIDGITYGKILDVYINSAFIITTIQNNTNTLGKLDLYTFLDKLIKSVNSALGGFNELELIIDETTNEIKIIDKNPLPNKDKLLKNLNRSISSAEFLLYGYTDTQASFVKDFNFKTEIPPSLSTTLVVASQNKGVVVGIDGTGFSNLNKNLTDRFKEKITNDISITDELRNNINKIISVNERWGEYKNFLISLSTDSSLGYTTDNCATKSNCNTYRTTLKDLIKINASFKDIKLPPPDPTVTKRTPVYDQDGNLEGYTLSDSKGIEDNERLVKTTNDLENLKNTLGRNNIGNPSSTSGFLPFNLSLTINGLSGMKMYQKFIIDTRYLPTNYPSNVEFLIKNIKHQISDQQWTTQLESFAITKNASSNQVQSQNYLNDSAAVSDYNPKINLVFNEEILKFPTIDQNIPNVSQGPLDPNDTTSLVVQGTTQLIWNPYNLKNYPSREVRQIIIHYTDYMNTPVGIVESLASSKKHNYDRLQGRFGIHYSIGRDGYIAKGVPEGQACIHGNMWNFYGIGIELVNVGYKPQGVQDPTSLAYGFAYPSPGAKIYQEYPDAQINALENLINEIIGRWPKIKEGIPLYSNNPKNMWNGGFWKIVLGSSKIPVTKRPPDNSWIDYIGNESNWKNPGLWPHAGGSRAGHSDPAPTPKLVNLLQKFGYSVD